jgi:glycine/sarcosine N-methyltransferase
MNTVPLYDDFSVDYDRFVSWEARLAFEMPFFKHLFAAHGIHHVLDVACGTGQHAIAFAHAGYEVTAADLSEGMVAHAQQNAIQAGARFRVHRLGFGELAEGLPLLRFDALTCLGNSLPHLLTEETLTRALQDFASVLKPEGVLIIQNRNLDRVLARQERFLSPEVHHERDQEWIFYRFYDFQGDLLRFNVLRLHRQQEGEWSVHLGSTHLRAWRSEDLRHRLAVAGFDLLQAYGSYREEAFDPVESGDLLLVAQRSTI